MPEPLIPGPETNRRVGEAMNVEPLWGIRYSASNPQRCHLFDTREAAEQILEMAREVAKNPRPHPDFPTFQPDYEAHPEDRLLPPVEWTVVPVYPDYSAPTGGAWEQARDWLLGQGWGIRFSWDRIQKLWWVDLNKDEGNWKQIEAAGPTMALAVCAAVLQVGGEG